jgi:hypothetical protein
VALANARDLSNGSPAPLLHAALRQFLGAPTPADDVAALVAWWADEIAERCGAGERQGERRSQSACRHVGTGGPSLRHLCMLLGGCAMPGLLRRSNNSRPHAGCCITPLPHRAYRGSPHQAQEARSCGGGTPAPAAQGGRRGPRRCSRAAGGAGAGGERRGAVRRAGAAAADQGVERGEGAFAFVPDLSGRCAEHHSSCGILGAAAGARPRMVGLHSRGRLPGPAAKLPERARAGLGALAAVRDPRGPGGSGRTQRREGRRGPGHWKK